MSTIDRTQRASDAQYDELRELMVDTNSGELTDIGVVLFWDFGIDISRPHVTVGDYERAVKFSVGFEERENARIAHNAACEVEW